MHYIYNAYNILCYIPIIYCRPVIILKYTAFFQPQVPLRLPCYDLTSVTDATLADGYFFPKITICKQCNYAARHNTPLWHKVYLQGILRTTQSNTSSRCLTGSVYEIREQIHRSVDDLRLLAIPASCSRVAANIPDADGFSWIRSSSRCCNPLSPPLQHMYSPAHKGHNDLTSSPPSFEIEGSLFFQCVFSQLDVGVATVTWHCLTFHNTV